MFKSKKIVALVLCAMMLFVPVAAMAAPTYGQEDFLGNFSTKAQALNLDPVKNAVKAYEDAVNEAIQAVRTEDLDAKTKALKEKAETFEKALKDANKDIAEVEDAMNFIKNAKFGKYEGYKVFTKEGSKDNNAANAAAKTREENDAKTLWTGAVQALESAQTTLKGYVDRYEEAKKFSKYAEEILKALQKDLAEANDLQSVQKLLTKVDGYIAQTSKPEVFAQVLKTTWDKYVALEKNALTVRSTYNALCKDAKKILKDADVKKSMTAEGWTVFTKNDKDVFANVAEMKVTKDGKKTVIKLYDAAGKEVKLNETLYVWMPIAKGAKVKNLKVDGGTVTYKTLKDGTIVEFSAEF